MAEPGSAREAAERSAEALKSGNLGQLMMDLTPDALNQVMQLSAPAGAGGGPSPFTPGAMPSISDYEITEVDDAEEGTLFHVRFTSAAGTATLATRWKEIVGRWRIAQVALIDALPTPVTD